MLKEFSDNMASWRMFILSLIIFVIGAAAVYGSIDQIKDLVGEDQFVFLRVFTTAKEPLLSFVQFLAILIPIVAIALGFDSVNSEFSRRTMSRVLAQPIYRDALLFGKFLAGLATIAVMLTALWLFVLGLGILRLGLAPNTQEVLRALMFLLASIAFGGVWLAMAMLFSVVFRSAATAALSALAVWMLFAFFWNMIVQLVAPVVFVPDPFDAASILRTISALQTSLRLSPNTLFLETAQALLSPETRSLALEVQLTGLPSGSIPRAPLPFDQSLVLIWPQLTGLLAGFIALFTVGYIVFQRQEVRA
jgi:ABC-2 type transport system permease protein